MANVQQRQLELIKQIVKDEDVRSSFRLPTSADSDAIFQQMEHRKALARKGKR
jgi:hypothetical protein